MDSIRHLLTKLSNILSTINILVIKKKNTLEKREEKTLGYIIIENIQDQD